MALRPQPPIRKPALLARGEQLVVALMILAGLGSIGGYWVWRGVLAGRLIDIDSSPPLTARFQLDVNKADWPELAQLPGVGETIAHRIVDERASRGPFQDHDDLRLRVKGIGPRTLERIRPFLLPMAETGNVADGKTDRDMGG